MTVEDHAIRPGATPGPTKRFRILCLSGGGYRGLFTVGVLERLEKSIGRPLAEHFDLIAGTSIGGIVAIGLSLGLAPATIREAFIEYGAEIFGRSGVLGRFGLFGSRYSAIGLTKTIDAVLGDAADLPLGSVEQPLIVTAVDFTAWAPAVFETTGMSPELEATSLRDVALATSAAPTYFPDHVIGGRSYVDGGLIANAPDSLAVLRALGRYGRTAQEIDLISIGTAGELRWDTPRKARRRGGVMLIAKDELVSRTMKAQENLSLALVQDVLGGNCIRIDSTPSAEQGRLIGLDKAGPRATGVLEQMAEEAFVAAAAKHGHRLNAMLR